MTKYKPLYALYKGLKEHGADLPDSYGSFERSMTQAGNAGSSNRRNFYQSLKDSNYNVPDTYEKFYESMFVPVNNTTSRARKIGEPLMSEADKMRFSAGAAAISESAKQIANNAGRYNRLKQRKQKQQKDFGRVNLGTHLTPFGGDANDVVKDDFAYNPETGKAGAYVTSDNENAYTQSDAEQRQAILDKYGEEWNKAVDMGVVPSELDKADPNLSDTDVAMRQMERRQEWLDENQNRRSKELNESMHLQDSPFVLSGGAVAPSSFNTSIGNEANRLSDVEYGAYNTAKAYNQMLRTTLLQELKEQKQKSENAGWWKDKWNDVSNYFGAFFNTMLDPKLYSQGVMDAAMANNMLQVKKGMEDGTIKKGSNAGNAAQAMFGAIQQQQSEAARQQQYGSKAYYYGDMSGRSLKFIGDFLMSGWREAITTGFTKAGEKVGEKMALGALGKWFTKNTGRVFGDIAGSAALAATNQLGSTYNNVIERYVGMNNENGGVTQDKDGDLKFNEGVSLGKAIKDGFGSATIENFSEMFGEYLPGASKLLSKLGLSKVSSFFEKIGNNAYYKWLSNATNKSGIQGVMAEISEEEFGTALHAAWGDGDGSWSDFNVFTNPDAREKQIDTCLGMFYSVGFMQSPRTAVGAINAVKYFHIKLQVTKADKFGQMMFNDKWDDIKSKIDVTTNADLTKTVLDATRSDSMTAKQKGAVINYAMFLSKLRGFNQASDAKTKDKVEEGETVPTLSNYLDDAYTEGHNADDADKHEIQLDQEDKQKSLAQLLGISDQQLASMSDDELEALSGRNDNIDRAIYDYQLSTARYQGVVDDAQDRVDLAAHQAAQKVDMYTDKSRGSVRNATIKASGGAEDYGVYIISGNIATNEDGSINVSGSDSMILYYDPTTDSVEHADALMFAELGEELPADDVKTQAVADAKENAIKEIAGIIDGTVDVGSQFTVTDADGTEHTYEVLADNGDGTAMITIDGNIPTELVKGENVQVPFSFEELQKMKDDSDQQRLQAAKAQREQMEKERAEQQNQAQTTQAENPAQESNTQSAPIEDNLDYSDIIREDGKVQMVDVSDKDGNNLFPDAKDVFYIQGNKMRTKFAYIDANGELKTQGFPTGLVKIKTRGEVSVDDYKKYRNTILAAESSAMPGSSMIEGNSGENRGGIEAEPTTIEDETTPDVAENTETTAPAEENAEETEQTPAMTLEDGTIVPMLEDGNPDFSKLTAEQTAELYDSQFGDDADSIVSGYVADAKKALDKATNMTVKGKTFVEQKAAKDAKEKAIADAQAAYDSAIAIRDAYNNRQLAKEENTPEGRKSLIEKARRKFARLKNSEEWSERSGDLWNETVGKLLHRLYDATGIDVFDDTPNTVYEYVAANVGPYSLNYEGNDNSKGVQQETGLSRSDFAKSGWLAAEGKGMTIDAKVHRLWENRPSNLESADTQNIRNALISLITSGQTAFQARDYILNQRIELAEDALEEQLRQEEDAAEAQKAKEEEENNNKTGNGLSNESNVQSNESNVQSNETSDEKVEEQNRVFGEQLDESDLPFSAKENGTQQTSSERAADVEKNKVDDIKVVDNIVGQKTRKTFDRLAKMMGANIQWQYSDKNANGWFDDKTNTIYLTLDSSITEGAQFIFGHEMTHQIKNLNSAAYEELKTLIKDMMGEDAFNKETDRITSLYNENNVFYNGGRTAYEEEVVADAVGEMIRDLNLAHTLAMKMSHPLLAAIHEILQKIKMAFLGTGYSDVTKNIIRSIEQAYVKTANGQVTNSETGEDVSFSLRQKPEPKKKGVGYKVFVLKDGKLYPPMVANPDGAATPVGVWLDADAAPIAGESKTGRPQVKQGGKGTQGGSGKLAYRPGWHLGVVPYAIQFNRKDAEGNKTLFPKNFVFAEVEYAADVDYQEEARQEGINPSGKYQHSLAGLKHLPTDGYYMYRTNPNPETDPWVITGAMKVNRILTRAEQADLVSKAGREPQQIQEGDIVTDDVVNSINQEIAAAPKFSLKVYHGSGADFTEFDFDHMGEGAGSQAFGWGGYVTSSEKIGKSYADLNRVRNLPENVFNTENKKAAASYVQKLITQGYDKESAIQEVRSKYEGFLDNLNRDETSRKNNGVAILNLKERIATLDEIEEGKLPLPTVSLYEVDIPVDDGTNYLDWDAYIPSSINKEDIAKDMLDDIQRNEGEKEDWELESLENDINDSLEWANNGEELYKAISLYLGDKAASKFLSSLGFTGIKYKAGTIFGGAKEGDTNYVIFKPEDMKITEHTKFSIKTYHGSQASFDKFDHSFMGSGEGAQAYGWGTYVSEVEGIAKAYAKQNNRRHQNKEVEYLYDGKLISSYENNSLYQRIFNLMEKDGMTAQNAINYDLYRAKQDLKKAEMEVKENPQTSWFNDIAIEVNKSDIEQLQKLDANKFKIAKIDISRNLYSVDIPDDTGDNYIGWDDPITPKMLEAKRRVMEEDGYTMYDSDRNYDYFEKTENGKYQYWQLWNRQKGNGLYSELSKVLHSDKLASLALNRQGIVGVKVIAGRTTGGNKEGKMNYVIFDENNAQITNRTKFSLRLKSAIDETETNPSDAQKESGNYKKGHIKFGGYDYTIENPKGSTRSGKDANGKEWKVTMHDTYGYIRGKFGKDGDHLDMFINDKADLDNWNGDVFVVDQVNPDGSFDEHKVMYGYDSMSDAEKAYLANYSKGWQGLGGITGASKAEFDKWLDTSNRKLKPFADYAKVKFSQAQSVAEPRQSLDDIKPVSVGAFGNIYNQFRGKAKAAIEFLKKLGSGEATAALHHHTIGDISLVWGDKKTGLDKILRKHPEVVDNLQSIIDSMEVVQESGNRIKLESPTHFAVVSKEYKGEPREQWLLTAYEKRESLENDKSMDTATSSLGGDTALSQSKGSGAKIDNSSETSKENGEKFSLKDEKTLAGVHNISEEKLLKAIKQGGLANPSVAVIDYSKQNHEAYGDISLILPSDKVAKRTGKNAGTWQGDAWTPTYPQVERQMSNKGAEKASKDVSSVPIDMYSEVRRGLDRWLDGGEANSAMAYMFLHEKGVAPEPKTIQHKFSDEVYNGLKFITAGDFNIYGIGKADAQKVLGMYIDAKFDGDKALYEEKTKAWLKKNKAIVDAGTKGGMRYGIAKENVELYEEYGFNYKGVQSFVRDVEYDHRKTGVDMNATLNEVENYIKTNNLTDEFNTWLEGKEKEYGIKEVIFDGFTHSGNRRYVPNTLENVSKIMKKQGRNGTSGVAVSFQNFAARLMPSYGTLKDIRSKKGLLTSNHEDLDKFNEKWANVFFELGMKCQPDATGTFDDYGLARLSEAAMTSDPQAYLKKEYNVDFSDEDTKRLKEMVKAIKEEYPAMYFETKFERPVSFDEFSSAVVPTTASNEVKQALQNAGVQIYEYDKEKEGDRSRAFNEAINSSDNIKFSLRGSTPYDKQMEEWMKKNHLEKGAVPMEKPIMGEGENIFDYANRMVEWTRNQNLWKTAPKQTGFQDALEKWKADNGLSPDAYPPVRPNRENYSTEIGYTEDLEEYNKKKELWKSAPKPKDFDLSVDLEDMNKQLRNIRRAVLNQKNYDQRTVKAVSDLVRKMLNIGWGDGLSRGKVGNLLSAAKNATGANDVKKYLDKAMGILAENYLNRLSTSYDNLINTKGARADQSGVIKIGSLDAKGQAFMSEYKKAINMDDKSLNTYIANIEEDSAKNEDNVEMNDYRLAGIQAAIMFKQQIGGNDADIAELQRQIGELKNKKDATKEDKELLKSLEKKLFENKFDRITMYENLLNNIQRMVTESKGRAKEFREKFAEHKNEILHRANLDLEGVDSTYYDTTTAKKKLVNNVLQRAVFSSTYTFEQFLKFFGKKAANGEGYLYNYFTKLNQDALDEEQLYNEMNRNALDEKTKEMFGKKKFMKLVGIDGNGMKEMDIEVTDYSNKKTGKRTIHLKQGQMLYIYLVNKETDGEMKLRAMGITEEDVDAIEANLDPRVKVMGEWLQDEYLPECQRRYQATHTKYFGAPMKEVENYFPLSINNRARNVKEDVNQDTDAMSQLAGTSTGAIVTRRVNVIPLDIENTDAFEVAFNHLQEMEEWSAMLPFRQDVNTLLSYTHFRNQVQNMSSVAYGSGKTLWDEFKQTAQIAAGTYKPKVNAGMMDSRIAAAMGGVAVAKISGRLWTAIKQSQSATVFLPECDFTRFVKNGVNPYGSWKWAMENIPDFRKRVENITYGDVKLRQYLDELEKYHDWTKVISKLGMAPNILVDGVTCAVGARSVYETEVNRLTKLGYPKEKAEEKAYYKAVAAYNKTQQSSGGMYLSPMQVDRTYVSAALSLFKNANFAYGRMQIEACRGLARTYDFWGGKHKTALIESMTRQIMEEDGLDENTARAIAKATYNRTFRQSIGRLINFATLVPVSWALYKALPYLLTGDDDDKKKDMIEEAVLEGFATSLSDNYVIPFASNILNAGLKVEDGKPTFDPEVFRYQNLYINPATSDLANIYSMIGNQKWYSVVNKFGMLGVQSLIGFNPETVGSLYQAFAEADKDNGNTAKEWQIGILKAISAPEESIRELYMDELGLKSEDIKKIPLSELEKRYAERQINRDNLLSQIFMDAEDFNGYVDKYQKSFEKKIKDKMDKWDEYDKKKADEFFDTTTDPKLKDMIAKKRVKDANAAADEQIAKEGLNQDKKGKEPYEEAYDAVKMSIDVAEDNAISTYNKVLNKRYAALNDEYNNQTDAMKYVFMSNHPNFKAYKDLESEYTTYGKKMKELKEKLVSADGYDAKQTILKQIRAEREKFSELQSKVR